VEGGGTSRSLAKRLLVLQLALVALIVVPLATASVLRVRSVTTERERARVLSVAETVAQDPAVAAALKGPRPERALQPLAERIRRSSDTSFVVVMSRRGIRYSHPDRARIGERFVGTFAPAARGRVVTETYRGTLGRSVRAVVPVRDRAGDVVGLVGVGVLLEEIGDQLADQLPWLLGIAAVALAIGAALSLLLARRLERQTLGLDAETILSLYESHQATQHRIHDGVIVADAAGEVLLVNDEARRLLGLVAGGPIPDGPVRELVASRREARDEILLTGERVLIADQGAAAARGRTVGTVTTLRDRTETQAMARELDSVRAMADSLRAQAHESANRLHTIVGLVELGRYDEAIAFATEQVEHAQDLLLRLQERVEEPALVALLLGKAAAARERGIELDVNPETPFAVAGASPTELVTIVGNLVDNAMDALAGREGPQWIAVTLWAEGGEAVIEVRDSGPGIPPGHAEKVFEAGWSTKAAGQGERGLGLALVRQTARRAGGSVTAASDGGAVFTVRLPAAVRKPEPA
jgi:two-component system, CitB family, sensor kinase